MTPHLVFLTGHLAEPRLRRVLAGLREPGFTFEVRNIGVKVAALMTPEIIRRRIGSLAGTDRVVLPGRCRGDLDALSQVLGVAVERGPEELADLPLRFGQAAMRSRPDRRDNLIFAEIVEAPTLDVATLLARARHLKDEGADVIDLGCLPDTPYPGLEEAVRALKREGFKVSVDSGLTDELARGAVAGADYLLSLTEDTLDLAFEHAAVPVLIPQQHGDLDSLVRAAKRLEAAGKPFFADPILDPIHFGFGASLARFHRFRELMPHAPMMMGVGNLTELTDADTTGISMLLMGICSELAIGAVLVVQVSPHCRTAVREADLASRILHAARTDGALPQGYDEGLMALRDRRPVTVDLDSVAANAGAVADRNFRIEVTTDGVHLYNRDLHEVAGDPYDFYEKLGVEQDGGHAFYLGVELARAQIAHKLGKRYAQDAELDWGVAAPREAEELSHQKAVGVTKRKRPVEAG